MTTLTFPYWPFPLAVQSLVVMCIIIVVSYRIPLLGWVRGFLLAFSLVSFHSHLFQMKVETVFHFGNDITINVRVDSFFKKISRGSEYLVSLESINEQNIPFFIRPNIKLVAPEGTNFRLGERWKLFVKVKPVFGRLNEAGFDQEKYYISQGWHAKAILKNVDAAELLEKSHSVRLKLYQTVDGHLDTLSNKAMLLALSFGNRNEISNAQWQQLKESGLIHLIAISGLHIGIAYLIGWKVGNAIRLIFHNWYSAPLVFALLFAATYSWLAGFSIPTLRALIMCCMLGLFSHVRIHLSVWQTLILTASGILIVDPFSLLSVSFSLTFLAVSCLYILSSYKRFSQSGWLKKTAIMQLTLSMIMLPVTGYFFRVLAFPLAFIISCFFQYLVLLSSPFYLLRFLLLLFCQTWLHFLEP
ncbi:ComEC/Rec2 family competence protein [Vibrio algarum]|uniref:ComEC/Rec2 family competence protein n=1 Tax=Vibrio algarum TaxID=3020714 RepID=A0ABT4YQB4_9VIBR|nr:ComEC/Rec2 family competence protein [Vibrio sp. KJ40-1]MDB1123570.1 ComEC/Rec2 family competence protein [Vibrio sp. KJ40-1]